MNDCCVVVYCYGNDGVNGSIVEDICKWVYKFVYKFFEWLVFRICGFYKCKWIINC